MSLVLIAGVDEAGRGALAGPVLAAAVILDPKRPIAGLKDSKQLTAPQRGRLAETIKARALAWSIGEADVAEIEELNILKASLLAMRRALNGLSLQPTRAQIDGPYIPDNLPYPAEAIIGGDQKIPAISAGSILAKVSRDQRMAAFDDDVPDYGFARHKGYGTARHLEALNRFGPHRLHRKTFAPIARLMASGYTAGDYNKAKLKPQLKEERTQ